MCGRYFISPDDPPERLAAILAEVEARERRADPSFALRRGEVAPGDTAAVIAPARSGQPAAFAMRWGFSLNKRLLFNARSETAGERIMFRDSFQHRRCLIPASAYFEWDHRQHPPLRCRFQAKGTQLLWLAGIYRLTGSGRAEFTVLTRDAVPELAPLHPRMPVLLPEEAHSGWLDPLSEPSAMLAAPLTALAWRPDDGEGLQETIPGI